MKEQADRLRGVDEETVMDGRAQREQEEEALMIEEVKKYGKVLGIEPKSGISSSQSKKKTTEITRANFEAHDLNKRPEGWSELRLKRIMLKEHIDRIGGTSEDLILEMRPEREVSVYLINFFTFYLSVCLFI
jgi:hypothetical protein